MSEQEIRHLTTCRNSELGELGGALVACALWGLKHVVALCEI